MRKLIYILLLVSVACSTQPKKEDTTIVVPDITHKPQKKASIEEPEIQIDLDLLQQVLNMKKSEERLGYFEKSFNTCKVGSGYSSNKNCEQLVFAMIHYRLRCRDTEGTTSEIVTEANMQDISNQQMIWRWKAKEGNSVTNSEGYGEVKEVFKVSPRNERLQLSNGDSFLYLRANQISTVITPSNWCR